MEHVFLWIKFVVLGCNILCGIVGFVMASLFAITVDGFRDQHLDWCLVGLVALIIVSFCIGSSATYQESQCLMWTHMAILVLCLNVQTILHLRYQPDDLAKAMAKKVEVLWTRESERVGPMSALEREFQCCGLRGSNDYILSNITLPNSCYMNSDRSNPKHLFSEGCWNKCVHIFTQFGGTARIVNGIVAAFELTALILSFFLAKKFRQLERRREVNRLIE